MISVIIPTYNRENTIERAVLSVLHQTYRDIECIVVDDGSDDSTNKIVNNIQDARLSYFPLKTNCGACYARNKGISLSHGEYIAFQDSDDVWAQNKLELQLKALRQSNADVCFCRKKRVSVDQKKIDLTHLDLKEGIVPYSILYSSPRVSTQTILAREYVFKEYNFDENLSKAQDYEWTIRAGGKYNFYFYADALVEQYFQNDSITVLGEGNYQTEKEVCEYLYQKFKPQYMEIPGLEIALLKRLALYKVLSNENASEEYRKLYRLTKGRKEYIEYLLEKNAMGILKRWFLYRRKTTRDMANNRNK